MIARRSILLGLGCAAAAGSAYALKPRREVSILGRRQLSEILPMQFGTWHAQDVGNLVAPKVEGSLASRLYNQTIERIYLDDATGAEVMMLMAHGARNTDSLQLHRPEACYPAFGFALSSSRAFDLPLSCGITVPARQLVADAPGRRESIIYWSRLGEFLPVDASQQRRDRLRTAMGGYVPDGLLARFSAIGDDPAPTLAILQTFVPSLLAAVSASNRDALIGTERAKAMGQALC